MSELDRAVQLLVSSPIRLESDTKEASTFRRNGSTTFIEPQERPTQSRAPIWQVPEPLLTSERHTTREAAASAARASYAAAEHPSDFNAIAHFGLRIQELAASIDPAEPIYVVLLLRKTCELYERACAIHKGNGNDARMPLVLFNWAIALSDVARFIKKESIQEAAECFVASATKYGEVTTRMPANARAFNNWGLVLQELAQILIEDSHGMDGFQNRKQYVLVLDAAISRFRAGLRLKPDASLSSRICYNLATVLHKRASAIAHILGDSAAEGLHQALSNRDNRIKELFSQSSMYITLAFALQPDVEIYRETLDAVVHLLPLPFLRAGFLQVPKPQTTSTPREEWISVYFALDTRALQPVRPPFIGDTEASPAGTLSGFHFAISDISSASLCASIDPSLPVGCCILLQLWERDREIRLIAETEDEAQCWVDVLRFVSLLQNMDDGRKRLESALLARRRRPHV